MEAATEHHDHVPNTPEPSPSEPQTDTAKSEVKDAALPMRDPFDILRIRDLEARLAEYDAKTGPIREYVKKMEDEVGQIKIRAERDLKKNLDLKMSAFFNELLPVADNLERSLKSVEAQAGGPFVDGIKLIQKEFQDVLSRAGLQKIPTLNETFNPVVHEALVLVPVTLDEQDGKIMEEAKAGYRFGEFVVRPAQVIVGNKVS